MEISIRWNKDFAAAQHLEGDCKNPEKLMLELYEFPSRRLLKVMRVESVSDGTLKVFLDTSEEKANAA
jgi:predicted ATPase